MKFSLAFLVALALSGAVNVQSIPVRHTDELNEIFEEFLDLVPKEELTAIVLEYLENDPEVQAIAEYIQTDEFRNLVRKVESIEDVIKFYDYLQESGLDVYSVVNKMHEVIGLPPLVPVASRGVRITGGIAGLVADVKALLPLEDIKALYHKKLETSPAFAQLIQRLRSPRFQELIDALRANTEFQRIVKFAKEHSVDVKAITDLLSTVLGLEFPSKHGRSNQDLHSDLMDFVALVPVEEVTKVFNQYLEEDAEVQAAVKYVQSEDFRHLVQKVESISDVINFYDYLQESGLDVYILVNAIHEAIGLPPLVPGASSRGARITGGIAGLVADVKALLPLEDIKALYHKKMETSPAFAQLVQRLRSPRFQELIDTLRANAEFQKIVEFAKGHGIDVKAIKDLLSTVLGLEFPSKHSRSNQDLSSDLMDFVALVPVEEVTKIFNQYLEEDAEVQAAVKYVQSEDFRHLVQKVESITDVINFYDYLQESGLDVYILVNAIHEAIGLPPLVPGVSSRGARITGGIAGLVADVKALLPLEDIKALYHKKLETSPAFAQLVQRLRSPRFQELIDTLRANAEFQKIVQFAKGHGIDVKAIKDLLSTVLGLEFPSKHSRSNQDLSDDLMDFVALVPVEEVTKVFNQYLEEDAEVQAVVKYVQSEDFRHLVQKVESITDVINFYDYLQESGLDVYILVNAIHEAIGLPPLVPGASSRGVRITGGIAGLVADVKALLPLEDIKALYHKKLETSPAFAQLVQRLRSPRFQELIDTLRANAEFQKIVEFAKGHGIDVKAIKDLLSTVLGLEFPSKHSRSNQDLSDDLMDFVALVPVEEVTKVFNQYLEEDAEVQAVVKYVQSEDFRHLVQKVESISDVINFYDYLQESGLNVYDLVNAIHEAIGLPPLVPGASSRSARITGGIAGLVADVKALLPLEDIKALYHKKLESSPAFAQLVQRLRSPRFQELIDTLRANVEFQKIVEFAKGHGIDVKAIKDLLSTVLGLEFPSKHSRSNQDLSSDLMDFVALVPVEEVTKVFNQYLEEDAEVQAVVKYVQSEDFRHLVQKVESITDVINFYDYLQESGLNVYDLVNAIHEAIGLPPLVPGASSRSARITGGIAGLVADVKALLPLEDIKALYHKKLETSPAFAQLVQRLRSPRFQELIDTLRANVEFQKIVEFAKGHGIDVKAIKDLLSTVLGLEFPSKHSRSNQDLSSDLMDFVALVPVEEVTKVFNQYLEEDAEVQAVVKYVQSEDFRHLVQKVESISDVINFYDYLQESGLNVYDLVNAIHEAIGLPPLVPGASSRSARITGGIAGLVADVKALLPLEDIKALYHKKLETSPAFAQLVQRLRSPRFQELIDTLRANVEFQKIVEFAKGHGIDVKAIKDLFSTVLGLEFPSKHSRSNQDLSSDLMDFVALVPVEEVTKVFNQYLEEDAEVQAVVKYVQSEDFRHLVQKVESISDVINFYDYLQESGLNVYDLVNAIHEAIGLPPLVPGASSRSARITGGIAGLVADVKALLPLEDIKALYHKKLESSPAFAQLVQRLRSPRFQELIDTLRANAEFQKIVEFAKGHGIDVKAIKDLLSTVLGLEFPNKNVRSQRVMTMIARNDLNDDLYDFLALLPLEEITDIVLDYTTNDKEMIETTEYLQTAEFHKVVMEVEAMKEAKDVLAFLQESGLDAYEFMDSFHDIIGMPSFQPYAHYKRGPFAATGGLAGLIADIKAILPTEEIKTLYYQKLKNSPSFIQLIKRLSSPEFQKFVDAVLEKKEVRVILDRLKGHGINLQEVADLVSKVLGLHLSIPVARVGRVSDQIKEELQKDLADFINLLPAEELMDIAIDYVFNDPQVQKAAGYVKSAEFKRMATAAQQNREFRRFIHYLDNSGLPVSTYINKVNIFLNLPEVVPSPLRRSTRAGGGVRGMLDAMEALLPHAEIKALFEHKKQNSDAFKYMLQRLHAEEFTDTLNELALNEDFRTLGFTAGSYGINLDRIVGFLVNVIGIEHLGERSARSLDADLQEFIDLVPAKEARRIVTKYYLFDSEFKAAVKFAKSPDFAQLLRDLHAIPEYNELLMSLEEAGLDVPTYVAKVHDFIGFKGFRFSREERKTGGIAGFIAEIKAIVPIADVKALYNHKIDTSEEFAALVELIRSNKFQAVTDTLFANKIFQDVLHRMQSHGIDLKAVSEFFLTVFGITTPPGVIDFLARL